MEKRVLIVDDEKPIRDMLSTAFNLIGYDPVSAESGEAALEILKQYKIHCMFLDLKLPGMNGLELCRKIRENYPMSCIHAITGHGQIFELLDCREAGFDDYFFKPIDLKIIKKAAEYSFEKLRRWRREN